LAVLLIGSSVAVEGVCTRLGAWEPALSLAH
jgi:hypothetical protein